MAFARLRLAARNLRSRSGSGLRSAPPRCAAADFAGRPASERNADPVQDLAQQTRGLLYGAVPRARVERDPVREHVDRELPDGFRDAEVAAVEQRARLRGAAQ